MEHGFRLPGLHAHRVTLVRRRCALTAADPRTEAVVDESQSELVRGHPSPEDIRRLGLRDWRRTTDSLAVQLDPPPAPRNHSRRRQAHAVRLAAIGQLARAGGCLGMLRPEQPLRQFVATTVGCFGC